MFSVEVEGHQVKAAALGQVFDLKFDHVFNHERHSCPQQLELRYRPERPKRSANYTFVETGESYLGWEGADT